jgi:hypothetical protein
MSERYREPFASSYEIRRKQDDQLERFGSRLLDTARPVAAETAELYKRVVVEERLTYSEHAGGHEFQSDAVLTFIDRHLRLVGSEGATNAEIQHERHGPDKESVE